MRTYDDWKTDPGPMDGPACCYCGAHDKPLYLMKHSWLVQAAQWVCDDCEPDPDELYQRYCDERLEP